MIQYFIEFINSQKELRLRLSKLEVFELVNDFALYPEVEAHKLRGDELNYITRILNSFVEDIKVHLVPAKRIFSYYAGLPYGEKIEFEDYGFIQGLFTIKNKLTNNKLKSSYSHIENKFKEVTNGHSFDIVLTKDQKQIELFFKFKDDPWFRADRCGLC